MSGVFLTKKKKKESGVLFFFCPSIELYRENNGLIKKKRENNGKVCKAIRTKKNTK